jgi:hypothetical protein
MKQQNISEMYGAVLTLMQLALSEPKIFLN